ncbi:MAG: low molecular weight phosphotyrosine protein phosphatase [Algiphilus sp.]|uniref:low molecular weight protein-tyrosine-phosphatase n=1 Tax=Algiphilus sp. TaxID=1872431 RepID=UPI0025BCCB36|nr:low molecular weight protein-tyrosine-phosphatase [Algiphilus sp.]MCI5103527.1 low molecular weight phosphotyrosine protein phosphatase [Algiphilus sp.]
MFSRVCVICTGNICRSPMGEALLRERAGDRLSEVYSAGTGALIGHPADPMAMELMQARGVDIGSHRAQQATSGVLQRADLLLVLDGSHLSWIHHQHPQMRGRSFRLLHWRGEADVPDPYRQPRQAFAHALELIEQGVDDWLARI